MAPTRFSSCKVGAGVNSGQGGTWNKFELPPGHWLAWRLYFTNGTYDSERYEWEETPVFGVQVLVAWNENGPTICFGHDEYRIPQERQSKFGQLIEFDRFYAIKARAIGEQWQRPTI